MDELNRPQSQENSALPTPPVPPYETAPQRPPLRFTVKDWLFVPVALLLGWLCMGAYNATSFLDYGPAGLGVTVFVTALLAAVFVRLGKKVQLNAFSLFCTACAFLLGLSCFLGGNAAMYFINAFITLAVGILAVQQGTGLQAAAGDFQEGQPCTVVIGGHFVHAGGEIIGVDRCGTPAFQCAQQRIHAFAF